MRDFFHSQNTAEDKNRWLYTLFIMLDANFRLKLKQRLIKNDIYLGDGLSYYVRGDAYKEHLKSVFEEKDVCFLL